MNNPLLLMIFLVFIGGCTSGLTSKDTVTAVKPELSEDQRLNWSLMLGKWYGSQMTKDGLKREHLVERYADGTQKITFRFYQKDGSIEKNIEVLNWGISGSVYFTIYRGYIFDQKLHNSNPADPFNYDAYYILKLSPEEFIYKSASSGNTFTIRKVDSDFTFK